MAHSRRRLLSDKGAKVVVALAPSARVGELSVWRRRDGKVLAAATKRARRKRVALNLKSRRRLRKGVYEVDVMALDRNGEQSIRRVRARLR